MDYTTWINGSSFQDPDQGELSYVYPRSLNPYVHPYTLFYDRAGNAYYQPYGWNPPFPLPSYPSVGDYVPFDINVTTGPYTHMRDDIFNGNIGTQMYNRPPVMAAPQQSHHGFNHHWSAQAAQGCSQPISFFITVPTGYNTRLLRDFLRRFWPLDLAANRGSQEATTWELGMIEQYKAAKLNRLPQGRQGEMTIVYSSNEVVPMYAFNPAPFPAQARRIRPGYRNPLVNGSRRAPQHRASHSGFQNPPIVEPWRSPLRRSSDLTPRATTSLERTSTDSSAEASPESLIASSSTQAVAGSPGIRTPSTGSSEPVECKPAELLPQNPDVDLLEQDMGILSLDE